MTADRVHRLVGRLAAPATLLLAATGLILALDAGLHAPPRAPAVEAASVADLVERLSVHGRVERIAVAPAGTVVVQFEAPRRRAEVDLATGELGPWRAPDETVRIATELHRSLFLGDAGRGLLALGSLATLVVAVAGVSLFRRRTGASAGVGRLHSVAGIAATAPLVISAATGLVLAAASSAPVTIDGLRPPAGVATAIGPRLAPRDIATLRDTTVGDLEELVAPRPDDPEDVWRLTTVDTFADLDPVDGRVVAARDRPALHGIVAALRRFHAGWGRPLIAAGFGFGAAAGLAATLAGLMLDRRRRRAARPTAAPATGTAETVILFGSEQGTTRRFAERLAERLAGLGGTVEIVAMNDLAPRHAVARRLLILTATAGEGAAPATATDFFARLPDLQALPPVAVLGFGDRRSAHWCGFAEAVDAAFAVRGVRRILPLGRVDRQSDADFAAWVETLLAALAPPAAPAAHPAPPPAAKAALPGPSQSRRLRLGGPAMGSRWSATIVADAGFDPTPLERRLATRLTEIEAALSRFRADSEVVRLDDVAVDRPIAIGADLAAVLAIGLDVGRRSNGAFDVGLAAEVAAAGFGHGWAATGGAPRPIRRPALQALDLDAAGRRLTKRAPIALDLAGIAKGWAVDEIARLVGEAGIAAFLVGLDGELRAGAAPPDARAWTVGVEAPVVGRRELVGRIDLVDRAVATSGDYRRFDAATGAGHTLSPATGRPVEDGPAAVTVLAAGCAEADAWATALMVADRSGLAAARAAGVEAIFVDRPAPPSPEKKETPRGARSARSTPETIGSIGAAVPRLAP